jgi:ferric-dicitrate binding protein FerR (iron transport regulator)
MSSAASIVQILWRYKNHDELSEEELAELREWLEESERHEDLFDDLSNSAKWNAEIASLLRRDGDPTWNRIKQRIEELSTPITKRKMTWRPYAVAASLAILFGAGLFVWIYKKRGPDKNKISVNNKFKNEILPASESASLTLNDGTVIRLDTVKDGRIAIQGLTSISKVDSNGLNYNLTSLKKAEVNYNTLTTAKGNQYHLTLPDGTNVWMNVASSIRFPVSFSGNSRSVELTGEAYFEVTKNTEKPFIVHVGSSYVKVMGTHFNIRSYRDELTLKTTLFEGSVLFSDGEDSALIKPGQQAQIINGGRLEIDNANLQQVSAWRNKLFWFQSTPFEEIMRELSRSYDIEVNGDRQVKSSFSGILPQNLPLSNLLALLEQGGNVHFTIDGKQVSVRP